MAISTQELILVVSGVPSTTQYLIFDCEDGRPSAVGTVQVWASSADDTSGVESATTGSASVETNPNTTLASSASAGATSLSVNSATGVTIGRRYYLTEDSTGQSEFIEVLGLNGTTVTTRHPIQNDYTAGATFQSTRVTIAVDSTWIADESNLSATLNPNPTYRVRWPVTVNGNQTAYATGFDVVRYPVNHGVQPLDVNDDEPGWIDNLPPDYQLDQGRALIEAAYQDVKFELYGDNKADQAVRNPELLSRLVIKKAQEKAHRLNVKRGRSSMEALEVSEKEFRQIYDQTFRSPVATVDATGGGGASTVRPTPLWVR